MSETRNAPIFFESEFVGYQEDNNRNLIIYSDDWVIELNAKIPGDEMDELLRLLRKRYS